ncbi:MAG: hypothetical protein J6A19_06335 [Oscillospiraceae bacterium]|nr:hypothetical protein [Oscillospiraceae bacterium]
MKKNNKNPFADMFVQRKRFQEQVESVKRDKDIAQCQRIRSADSYYDWSLLELSPEDRLKGLYVLSSLGSFDALEWLIDEAYCKSRIEPEKGKRKKLSKKARKYLSAVAIHSSLTETENQPGRSWLIKLGDYHLGLLGKVRNMSLNWAARYYAMAIQKQADNQLQLKFDCVKLLMGQLSDTEISALERKINEHDFVAFAVAHYYLYRMSVKKKKHGKRYSYYKSMVGCCLESLKYAEGRYVDDLFHTVLKSKLFR